MEKKREEDRMKEVKLAVLTAEELQVLLEAAVST
jgi:hypothetical protein